MTETTDRALRLKALHEAPAILRVVNVWDAISAKTVAALPETAAIATAGHSIAASYGYPDGGMPLDLALAGAKTVVDAVDLPVTADLDDGYEDPAETIRRAIGLGIVGANVEDRLRPFDESVARVAAIIAAAESEGVAFQLNARTDAIVRGGERPIRESGDDANSEERRDDRAHAVAGEGRARGRGAGLPRRRRRSRVRSRCPHS